MSAVAGFAAWSLGLPVCFLESRGLQRAARQPTRRLDNYPLFILNSSHDKARLLSRQLQKPAQPRRNALQWRRPDCHLHRPADGQRDRDHGATRHGQHRARRPGRCSLPDAQAFPFHDYTSAGARIHDGAVIADEKIGHPSNIANAVFQGKSTLLCDVSFLDWT
jgi:hypothetical protein